MPLQHRSCGLQSRSLIVNNRLILRCRNRCRRRNIHHTSARLPLPFLSRVRVFPRRGGDGGGGAPAAGALLVRVYIGMFVGGPSDRLRLVDTIRFFRKDFPRWGRRLRKGWVWVLRIVIVGVIHWPRRFRKHGSRRLEDVLWRAKQSSTHYKF